MTHKISQQMIQGSDKFIVTKHICCSVKAKGITVIPVWRNKCSVAYPDYAGYEIWRTLVAVEPHSHAKPGTFVTGGYLYRLLANHACWATSSLHRTVTQLSQATAPNLVDRNYL